jgi:hypothetical protein
MSDPTRYTRVEGVELYRGSVTGQFGVAVHQWGPQGGGQDAVLLVNPDQAEDLAGRLTSAATSARTRTRRALATRAKDSTRWRRQLEDREQYPDLKLIQLANSAGSPLREYARDELERRRNREMQQAIDRQQS